MSLPKSVVILFHLVAWLLFFGLIIASSAINRQNSFTEILSPPFLLFYLTYLIVFYLNELLLLPKLYLKKKYIVYTALIAGLLLSVTLLQPFDNVIKGQRTSFESMRHRPIPHGFPPTGLQLPAGQRPPDIHPNRIDFVSIILFITVWMVSIALALFRQWRQTELRAAQAEIDKAKAELSFLKAQVNPHFLFNTLNNIYALSVEKSNRTPEAIMKLSNIMRYVTDEAKNDFVPLPDEVACITDYINLQQLRLTDKTTIAFTVSGALESLQIAPLILMPFVENVFKYGITNHGISTITIKVRVDGRKLNFATQNRIFKTHTDAERTGIGIENTKKRLQHLYPGRHNLLLDKDSETFIVQLIILL